MLAFIVFTSHAQNYEDACSICLIEMKHVSRYDGNYDKNKEIVTARCGHKFHLHCIARWFKASEKTEEFLYETCALCRQQAVPLARASGPLFRERSIYCETEGMLSCRTGDSVKLAFLLSQKKSIAVDEFISADKFSLLHFAVAYNNIDCVKLLINFEADVHYASSLGMTSLDMAATLCYVDIMKVLIKAGAEIEKEHLDDDISYLHLAIVKNSIDSLKFLIESGMDVNRTSAINEDDTCLIYATKCGFIEGMKLLIEAGADVNLTSNISETCLQIANKKGNVDMVEILIKAGAIIDGILDTGKTCLQMAVQNEDVASINLMIEGGEDVNITSNTGETCLHIAVICKNADILKLLIDKGVEVNSVSNIGLTSLHIGVIYGYTDRVKMLIEAGADIDATEFTGKTCLHLTAESGEIDSMKILLEAGASINNILYSTGETCLHIAVKKGNVDMIEALLKAEAKVNIVTSTGEACLHLAAENEDIISINLLIKAGGDVNLTSKTGETCLHIAVKKVNVDIIKTLIKAGANVNLARTSDRATPLSIAISLGHDNCSDALSEAILVLQKAQSRCLGLNYIHKLWSDFSSYCLTYIKKVSY